MRSSWEEPDRRSELGRPGSSKLSSLPRPNSDASEAAHSLSWLQRRHDIAKPVNIGFTHLDVEDIHISKFLEKYGLAFHYRFGGKWANVAKTQDCSTVRNYSNQITPPGVCCGHFRICFNVQTRCCNSWRIGKRQITLVSQGLCGAYF